MEALKPKPAFVTFEVRAVENRAEQIAAGMPRYSDVEYAFITPAGSKDRIEKIVAEWLPQLKTQITQGLLPEEFGRAYLSAYKYWKEGKEAPVEGLDLRNWPGVTPAQLAACLAVHVRCVEELAAANEETMNRIGMGARALKIKAEEYLKAAGGAGKTAEEITSLRVALEDAQLRNKSLEERMEVMATTLQILQKSIGQAVNVPAAAAPTSLEASDIIGE